MHYKMVISKKALKKENKKLNKLFTKTVYFF